MRFVDLNTGAIYNGNAPYIHWFSDEQSTNLIYEKKLCFISDYENVTVNINSDIFSLIDMESFLSSQNEIINDFSYKNIGGFKTNKLISKGFLYNIESKHKVYLHVIYIIGSSKYEGEFLEDLYIDGEKIILGSSFYDKYEPHKINLSNFGVDIPESITRAIYDTNVHEEEIDNITANRKFKELLNEYWNIIANKGSYKSLYNSLSWFEYGDLIKLKELWKNESFYNQQDITSYVDTKIRNYLHTFYKTTYIGLYLPLQKLHVDENNNVIYPAIVEDINSPLSNTEDVSFTNALLNNPIPSGDALDQIFEIDGDIIHIEDETPSESKFFDHSDWDEIDLSNYIGFIREDNPELINIASKWSQEDLCLKMYLVGNFFESYFMPIHLDLIHSTVENVVFTNTIKIFTEPKINRVDYINNCFTFNCNIKDNDIFFLEDVNSQVGPDTLAGVLWTRDIEEYEDMPTIGVDSTVLSLEGNLEYLKTFMSQYYNGVGKIINFKCNINIQDDDFIKMLKINIEHDNRNVCKNFKLLSDKTNSSNIEFNILCKNEGEYKVTIEFITANQYNYIKEVTFNVLDNSSKNIKIYKVKYNTKPVHSDKTQFISPQDYIFTHYRGKSIADKDKQSKMFIPEYIQQLSKSDLSTFDDVFMHKTIIITGTEPLNEVISDYAIRKNTEVMYKYKWEKGKKQISEGETPTYTIYILPTNTPVDFELNIDKSRLVRNDFVFYPNKHHLEPIASGNNVSIDDYTFTQKDVLMVVSNSKYLKYIEDPEWEFENISKPHTSKPIKLKYVKTPFIANADYKLLDPGFYNVKFRYRLGQTIQEVSLDSAFRIV